MQWHLGLLNQMYLKLVVRSAEEMQLQVGRLHSPAASQPGREESCLHNVTGSILDQKPFLARRLSVFCLLLL